MNSLLCVLLLGLILIIIYDTTYIEPFDVNSINVLKPYYSKKNFCNKISKKKELKCDRDAAGKAAKDTNKNIENCICDNNTNALKDFFNEIFKQILLDVKSNLCSKINTLIEPHVDEFNKQLNESTVSATLARNVIDKLLDNYTWFTSDIARSDEIKGYFFEEITILNNIIILLQKMRNNNYYAEICNIVDTLTNKIINEIDMKLGLDLPYDDIIQSCNKTIFKSGICDGFTVGGQITINSIITKNMKGTLDNSKLCKKIKDKSPGYCKQSNSITFNMLDEIFNRLLMDLNTSYCDEFNTKLGNYLEKHSEDVAKLKTFDDKLQGISDFVNLDQRKMIWIYKTKKCENSFDKWKAEAETIVPKTCTNTMKPGECDSKYYDTWTEYNDGVYKRYINAGMLTKKQYDMQEFWCDKSAAERKLIMWTSPDKLLNSMQVPYLKKCETWQNMCKFDCRSNESCQIEPIKYEENIVMDALITITNFHAKSKEFFKMLKKSKIECDEILKAFKTDYPKYKQQFQIYANNIICSDKNFDYCS